MPNLDDIILPVTTVAAIAATQTEPEVPEEQLTSVSLDEVVASGQYVGLGLHKCRIAKAEYKMSKKGKPMTTAAYEVLEGDEEGKEITLYFTHYAKRGRDGKMFAPGISEMKRQAALMGKPMTGDFPLNEQAAKLYHKHIGSAPVAIKVSTDLENPIYVKDANGNPTKTQMKNKNDELMYGTKTTFMGPWKGGRSAVNPLA